MEQVLSVLMMTTGVLAASVGVAAARSRVRAAQRAYEKTSTVYAAMPEGWSSWFLGGFSSLTMATRALRAAGAWLAWTVLGVGLIGCGIWLS